MEMSLRRLSLLMLAAFSLALVGCGEPGPRTFQTTLLIKDSSGIEKSEFAGGEPITFVLTVTNLTNTPVTITQPSPQVYDFVVADSYGSNTKWNWSDGMGFACVITYLEFSAGETKTYEVTWDQMINDIFDLGEPVPPGNYRAYGYVKSIAYENPDYKGELTSGKREFTVN